MPRDSSSGIVIVLLGRFENEGLAVENDRGVINGVVHVIENDFAEASVNESTSPSLVMISIAPFERMMRAAVILLGSTSALNFRLIGLVHLVEIRPSHVGFRPTLGLVSSGQTKGVLVFVGSPSR